MEAKEGPGGGGGGDGEVLLVIPADEIRLDPNPLSTELQASLESNRSIDSQRKGCGG
jgi:hypothetical protein